QYYLARVAAGEAVVAWDEPESTAGDRSIDPTIVPRELWPGDAQVQSDGLPEAIPLRMRDQVQRAIPQGQECGNADSDRAGNFKLHINLRSSVPVTRMLQFGGDTRTTEETANGLRMFWDIYNMTLF
ncbi:hypothetical protein PRIPAC_92746, partial [Pristionchus pacificus]|uniref:Uncharacterized protein n=1 Tax=Pristionchus pacificus TaxID=54126 RepID=A0A2A6BIM3_PRIPA